MSARDGSGKSALHYCVENTSPQLAELLVMVAPGLVGVRDSDGYTPLHLAVIAGNHPVVCLLLRAGSDVNGTDNEGHTLVHWAIGEGGVWGYLVTFILALHSFNMAKVSHALGLTYNICVIG